MFTTIDLYLALKYMRESTTPFTVEYVTYSETRQTGGKIVSLSNVLVAGQQANINSNSMIAFKAADIPDGEFNRAYIWSIRKFNDNIITW